jgi:hypothetical protein
MRDVLGFSWDWYCDGGGLKGRWWRRIRIIDWMVGEIRICWSSHIAEQDVLSPRGRIGWSFRTKVFGDAIAGRVMEGFGAFSCLLAPIAEKAPALIKSGFWRTFAGGQLEICRETVSVVNCAGLGRPNAFLNRWFIDTYPVAEIGQSRGADSPVFRTLEIKR